MMKIGIHLISLLLCTTAFGFDFVDFIYMNPSSMMERELPDLKNLNWQVGEYQERTIKKGAFGVGSLKSWVDREEGDAFWLLNDLNIIFQGNKRVEALIERATGKILRYIEDGQEKSPPDVSQLETCEDLGESYETVNVPAGKFESTRTVLKCDDNYVAIWIHHGSLVNMNGHVRQALLGSANPTDIDYLVELTKYGQN